MRRTSRSEWKKIVKRWKRSGLEARDFAEREGVKPKTLWWWGWRLARERRQMPKRVRTEFVEISPPVIAATPAVEPIELLVGEQVRVLVPNGFEAETLRRVLAVIEGR